MSRFNLIEANASSEQFRFLNLFVFSDQELIEFCQKRGDIPQVWAELMVRYYFSCDETLKNFIAPYVDLLTPLTPGSKDDIALSYSGNGILENDPWRQKVKNAWNERANYLRRISGTFPVYAGREAWLLPFTLHQAAESACVDASGRVIPEWDDKIKAMELSPAWRVEVGFVQNSSLLFKPQGGSLQLSVYLAQLVLRQQMLPYNPFRLIITGAVENDCVAPVQVQTKYQALSRRYLDSYFLFPVPQQEVLGEQQENMLPLPTGTALEDVRRLTKEYILKYELRPSGSWEKRGSYSPWFFGRRQELARLHNILNTQGKVPFIHAVPGMGKTALTEEYARIFTPFEYPESGGVALLYAQNGKTLPDVFRQLWDSPRYRSEFGLKIPEEILSSPDDLMWSIKKQLNSRRHKILLILDNIAYGANPDDLMLTYELAKYFPDYAQQNIQIMASSQGLGFAVAEDDLIVPVGLEGLRECDALDLMKSKRPFDSPEERLAAQNIISYLGGNAWAVSVVAETLKQVRRRFPDDYQEKWRELQKIPVQEVTVKSMVRIRHGAIDPITLMAPMLDKLTPEQQEVVIYAATLAPEHILPEWLREAFEFKHPGQYQERAWQNEIIAPLQDMHFFSEDQELFRMHRLSHIVLRNKYSAAVDAATPIMLELIKKHMTFQVSDKELLSAGQMFLHYPHEKHIKSMLQIAMGKIGQNMLTALALLDRRELVKQLVEFFQTHLSSIDFDSEQEKLDYKAGLIEVLARIETILRNFTQARQLYRQARDLLQNSTPENRLIILGDLTNLYLSQDDCYRAENILQSTAAIIKENNLQGSFSDIYYLTRRGILSTKLNLFPEAIKYFKSAIELRQQLPEKDEINLANTYVSLGNAYRNNQEYISAQDYYNFAETILKQNRAHCNFALANCYENMSALFEAKEEWSKALTYRLKAVAIQQKRLPNNHLTMHKNYQSLCAIYKKLGDEASAEKYARKFQNKNDWENFQIMADTLRHQGKIALAINKLENLLQKQIAQLGENDSKNIYTESQLAECLIQQGDLEAGEKHLKNSYELFKKIFPDDLSNVRNRVFDDLFAKLNFAQKNYVEALNWSKKYNEYCEVYDKNGLNSAIGWGNYALYLYYNDKLNESLLFYHKSSELFQSFLPEEACNYYHMRENYLKTLIALKRYDEALKIKQQVIRYHLNLRNSLELSWQDAHDYSALSELYYKSNDLQLGMDNGAHAIKIYQNLLKSEKKEEYVALYNDNLAHTYRLIGQYDQALLYHEKALAMYQKLLPEKLREFAEVQTNYARTLITLKRFDEALILEHSALALREKFHPEPKNLAQNHLDLGRINLAQNLPASALDEFKCAETLAERDREAADIILLIAIKENIARCQC